MSKGEELAKEAEKAMDKAFAAMEEFQKRWERRHLKVIEGGKSDKDE